MLLAASQASDFIIYLVPVGLALYVLASVLRRRSSRSMLNRWTAQQHIRLVSQKKRGLLKGPFATSTGIGQAVFRLTATFPDGKVELGWAKCGFIVGLWCNAVEVIWDFEKPQAPGFPVILPIKQNPLDDKR